MEALGYPLEARVRIRDAYMVAASLSTGAFRASGRTFIAHLVGTASIMAAFGANPAVIAATLLHAAYAHGRFPDGFSENIPAMRRWLERRVGGPVEDLVYQYSRLQLEQVESYTPGNLESMPIPLANAVLIRIANGIEDRIAGDDRYFDSAKWLSESNAQIERWMPCFTAVAGRLVASGMAAILRETVAAARVDVTQRSLRPVRPLNYSIEAGSTELRGLNGRNLLADHTHETNGAGASAEGATQNGGGSRYACSINLDAIASLNGGSVSCDAEGITIVADPQPWAYSARLLPKEIQKARGRATIEISLLAERGSMGIAVLERGSSVHHLAPEQSVNTATEHLTVRFEIAAIEEAGEIIFRAWPSQHEGPARVCVHSVNVLLDAAPAPTINETAEARSIAIAGPADAAGTLGKLKSWFLR